MRVRQTCSQTFPSLCKLTPSSPSTTVYGLSVFDSPDPSAVPFTSVLSIDVEKEAQCHPGRVHHLYGASKDFCMNGLRIGVLHTRNERLADAFTATALFNKIGSPSDSLFSALVNSSEHLDWFLATNRERLSHAYRYATRWLEENEVPYRPSHAGHFIWSMCQIFYFDGFV